MLKTILKIALAAGILYWLVSQGKLDFSLIAQSFKNPGYFILGIILVSTQLLLGAYRLGFFLNIKSSKIEGRNLIGPQWIGQLFASVLPGAFTSDLLKIGYIKKLDEGLSKSYILFVILIDRLIGLNSLLFISGFTSIIFFKQLSSLNPAMEKIIYLNLILFILSISGMSLLFLKKNHQAFLLKFIPFQKLKGVAIEIWKLSDHSDKFILAYASSIIGHLLAITAFWVINIPFFETHVSYQYFATLIPLGQLAVVIPISPGGIGVGHAAFSSLFGFIGHHNGASLYNVYWVMCLVISLFGIIPFVLHKSKLKEN